MVFHTLSEKEFFKIKNHIAKPRTDLFFLNILHFALSLQLPEHRDMQCGLLGGEGSCVADLVPSAGPVFVYRAADCGCGPHHPAQNGMGK